MVRVRVRVRIRWYLSGGHLCHPERDPLLRLVDRGRLVLLTRAVAPLLAGGLGLLVDDPA